MTIKQKNKRCVACNREDMPWFSKKLCKFCAMKTYKKKPKTTVSKQSAKKSENKVLRDVYFDYHIPLCTYSEETGAPIYNAWRGNIAHVLDKSRHPSVQDNLDNYIYLTIQEHTRLDGYLFKNEFDKIIEFMPNTWKIICERIPLFINDCTEDTKFKRKLIEKIFGNVD